MNQNQNFHWVVLGASVILSAAVIISAALLVNRSAPAAASGASFPAAGNTDEHGHAAPGGCGV